ncbi:MAG: sigma-70 family RNA polymerase sigma factor [Pseudomonadota bacterium]
MTRLTEGLAGWRKLRTARRAELIQALNAHAGLMIATAIRVLGSLHDAEDIAQDIAEKLLRSPPPSVHNWPAYLKTLSVNRAIDRLRQRRPTVGTDDITHSSTPESELEASERADALRDAVATLKQRDATLFSLYYLADLNQAEIGRQLDMTESAVGVALHRIRQRLSSTLRTQLQLGEKE